MQDGKVTTKTIGGIEFDQPYKMKKKRFVQMYSKKFGDKTEDVFEELTKKK